jgi:beta-lactam-binding protein with PASTA domain
LNQAQAEAALAQRGLAMVASTQQVADSSQHGRVIDQDPNPGDTLLPGDSVDVVFGEFIPPTTTTTAPTTTTTTTTPPTTSG